MKKENPLINLEMINNEYDFIIYDTCALCHFLQGKNIGLSMKDVVNFAGFLTEKVSKGYNCFLPSSVIDEYSDFRERDFSKEKTDQRRNLIDVIKEHERVIKLTLQEQNCYREYIKLFPEYKEKYGVTFTDFEVFFYGAIFSEMRGPTAIISNDIIGISRIWNDAINQSSFNREKLGFFVRRGRDLYERF